MSGENIDQVVRWLRPRGGEDLEQTVHRLRTVELHRAVRGVDPDQARRLLDEAAELLAGAVREQKELRREVEQLRASNDKDAIVNALVTATRTSEQIVAEARETAAKITAEAEGKVAVMLEEVAAKAREREEETAAAREELDRQLAAARSAVAKAQESARAEAEAALTDARRELDRLEAEAARLRSAVTGTQRHVVEIVRAAIDKLEALDADTSRAAGADLLVALRPANEAQPVQAPSTADRQSHD